MENYDLINLTVDSLSPSLSYVRPVPPVVVSRLELQSLPCAIFNLFIFFISELIQLGAPESSQE